MKKLLAILLVIMFISVGCASKMVIRGDVPGSEVYVNGELIGSSPATYSGKSGLNKQADIMLRHDGYADAHKVVTQEVATGQLVVCLLLFWPCVLWTAYWPANTMVPQRRGQSGAGQAGTQQGSQQMMQGPTVIIQQPSTGGK